MARIPLEDNFDDVINKAQIGLGVSDADLAAAAEVTPADLAAVKGGEKIFAVIRRVARHLKLNPDALEELANKAWYPDQARFPRGFAMFNTPFGDMTVNAYLLWDSKSRQAMVIDTGADVTAMLDVIEAERLDVRYIFITHTHEDHIADLARLVEATKAPIWASEREPVDFPGAQTFVENTYFHVGELSVKTLSTWGHSPGMTTFLVKGLAWPVAIVGDAIFSCSMGGSPRYFREQYKNTRSRLFGLPKDTVLAPGHGPLTTLRQEIIHNPFFARVARQPRG